MAQFPGNSDLFNLKNIQTVRPLFEDKVTHVKIFKLHGADQGGGTWIHAVLNKVQPLGSAEWRNAYWEVRNLIELSRAGGGGGGAAKQWRRRQWDPQVLWSLVFSGGPKIPTDALPLDGACARGGGPSRPDDRQPHDQFCRVGAAADSSCCRVAPHLSLAGHQPQGSQDRKPHAARCLTPGVSP